MTTQINLPFVTATQEGPKHLDLQLTRAKLGEITADLLERTVGPTKAALADAGLDASRHRPRRPRRRHDPHAGRAGEGEGAARQGPAQGRQPGRGRRRRRRDPGRRAQGRGQGRAPARRDAAVARHRDQGRRLHEADRAQHDDPDPQVGDVLDGRGQPAVGRDPRPPGRVGDGDLQQDARQVPARRHPAGAAGHAADRGRLRHRRERDHPRRPPRTSAPGTSSRSGSRAARASPRTRCSGWCRRPRRTPRRRTSCASSPTRGTRPSRSPTRRSAPQGAPRQARRGRCLDDRGPDHGAARSLESTDVAEIQAKTQALEEASRKLADAVYAQASAQAQSQAAAGATATRPATRTRSSRTPTTRSIDEEEEAKTS